MRSQFNDVAKKISTCGMKQRDSKILIQIQKVLMGKQKRCEIAIAFEVSRRDLLVQRLVTDEFAKENSKLTHLTIAS